MDKKLNKKSLEPIQWILDDLSDRTEEEKLDWEGNMVENCIPRKYDVFLKILHPIYDSLDYKVEWKELARRLNILFYNEISWDSFMEAADQNFLDSYVPAEEGSYDEIYLIKLLNKLLDDDEDVFMFYDEVKVFSSTGQKNSKFVKVNKKELSKFFIVNDVLFSPTYIWSESKKWLIASPLDLTFSLMGMDYDTYQKIEGLENFEYIEVEKETRIDVKKTLENIRKY